MKFINVQKVHEFESKMCLDETIINLHIHFVFLANRISIRNWVGPSSPLKFVE